MQRIEDTVADVLEAMRKRGIGDHLIQYGIHCLLHRPLPHDEAAAHKILLCNAEQDR